MRLLHLLLLVLLVPAACSHPPRLHPLPPELEPKTRDQCDRIYPQGKWQLLHSIEALTPDGGRTTVMGLTLFSSRQRLVHCVLLTLEGLVLFEARYDGTDIVVQRALPPFDSPGFSRGLFDDIMLMLLPPDAAPATIGRQADAALVCRWRLAGRAVQDNVHFAEQSWEIRRYNDSGRLTRLVRIAHDDRNTTGRPMASVITLKAFGLRGYDLVLKLLEARPGEFSLSKDKGSP